MPRAPAAEGVCELTAPTLPPAAHTPSLPAHCLLLCHAQPPDAAQSSPLGLPATACARFSVPLAQSHLPLTPTESKAPGLDPTSLFGKEEYPLIILKHSQI